MCSLCLLWLILLLCFGRVCLGFGVCSGFLFSDRLVALVAGRGGRLGSFDQLLGGISIRSGGLERQEFLECRDRLRNRVRRSEVGNTELVISRSHRGVQLNRLFECLGSVLGFAFIRQHSAEVVIALAGA